MGSFASALGSLSEGAVGLAAALFVQSTLLVALGLLLARMLREKGAALQSVVLRVTLLAVLLSPIATLCLREAGVRGLALDPAPVRPSSAVDLVAAPEGARARLEIVGLPAPGPAPIIRVPAEPAGAGDRNPPVEPAGAAVSSNELAAAEGASVPLFSISVAILWALGSGLLLLRILLAHLRMFAIRRRAERPAAALVATCEVVARRIGVRPPLLLLSRAIRTPCLHGLFRPAILLPRCPGGESAASKEIFVHELAHLARRDCAWNLLAHLARALVFYQPLLWILTRKIERASDDVADDHVILYAGDRRRYAHQLVDLAERLETPTFETVAGVGAVPSRSSLGRRVRRILETTALSIRAGARAVAVSLVLGLGVVLAAGLIGAGGEEAAEGAETAEAREGVNAADTNAPNPPPPAPPFGRKTIANIAPPFTFKIHAVTPQGRPQAGVKIRCLHPRQERGEALIDAAAISDELGVAEFRVAKADLIADRYFWFSLAGDDFAGMSGAGISPVDGEFEYTFRVAPAVEVRLLVAGESGSPLPGARVRLIADWENSAVAGSSFRAWRTAHAGPGGVVETRFAAGRTNIVASADGYAPTFVPGAVLSGAPAQEIEVVLGKGFGIRGRVTDEQGLPLEGVRVTARRKDFALGYLDELILEGRTDGGGGFELPHAAGGTYEVRADLALLERPLFAAAVTLPVGELTANFVEIAATAGAVLKGTHTARGKLPVAGRGISVRTDRPHEDHWQLETGAGGSFAIHLPAGSDGSVDFIGVSGYYNFVEIPREYRFLRGQGRGMRFLGVPSGIHDGLEVRFLLAGRANGVVRDASGHPVANARLVVEPGGRLVELEEDGSYSVEVPPGRQVTLRIDLRSSGGAHHRSEPFEVGEGEIVEVDITLPEGKGLHRWSSQGEIAGRVLTPVGKPAAGATVYLSNSRIVPENLQHTGSGSSAAVEPTWKKYGIGRPAMLESEDGTFRFDFLLPGATDVWAHHPEHGWGWARDVTTELGSPAIEIVLEPETENVRFTGRILDADGKPLANAPLWIYGDAKSSRSELFAETRSDADGRFSLELAPPWAHFRHLELIAAPEGGAIAWKTLPPASGDGLELRSRARGAVSGRIVDRAGEPVEGAVLRLHSASDREQGVIYFWRDKAQAAPETRTGAAGEFTLDGAPAGSTISLYADHEEFGAARDWNIDLVEGETRIPDIVLPDGITIEGTVRYAASEKPASGITVAIEPWGRNVETVTSDDGSYRFAGLEESFRPATELEASDGSSPPRWRGSAVLERKLREGERVTGVDIVLEQSIEARKAEWELRKGKPAGGSSRVVILDDADPAYKGKASYGDTLAVRGTQGEIIWKLEGFNTAETVGAAHRLAWHPRDRSIWVATDRELFKLDENGSVVWRKGDLAAGALAVDPKDGRVWVLYGDGQKVYGEGLAVIDAAGGIIADYPLPAFDIAYSKKGDCFWLAGKKVRRIDRAGEVLYESLEEFPYMAVAVATNDRDGSAWIVERRHPDVAGSRDRLIILEADGVLRSELLLHGGTSGGLAVDGKRGAAWLGTGDGVLRITARGEVTAGIPLAAFSLAVEDDTGCVWVAARDGIYRLDPRGNLLWSAPSPRRSQKWIHVFEAEQRP